MKLLARSTYYFFLFSILAMLMAGILFYYTIRTILYNEIDDSLVTEKTIIQDQIEETNIIPDFTADFNHLIEVRLFDTVINYSQVIDDTSFFDVKSKSNLPFRHLRFSSNTPAQTGYTIDIYQILDENQKLLHNISLGMFFQFLSLLFVSLAVNYLVSKKVLSPFFNAVNEAAKFDVLSDKPLELPETSIMEFKQLNMVIEQMTKKMRTDYINLKEYNENSSHEIQTPLSIIRSKLDILMQNEKLDKKSINLIKSINEAAARLFKLNQGFLLISKIENLQFSDSMEISLKKLIEKCLANYEEIMDLKKITVETDLSDNGLVLMNETLADIMISNLISNAVRYNFDHGFIRCHLDRKSMIITNSGPPIEIDPKLLFKRFHKGKDHPNSVGLGLSIVKKIVEQYKMNVSYTTTGTVHEIKLDYREQLYRNIN